MKHNLLYPRTITLFVVRLTSRRQETGFASTPAIAYIGCFDSVQYYRDELL